MRKIITMMMVMGWMSGVAQTTYITNYNSSTVTVIDVTTNAIVTTICCFDGPYGISASQDGNNVFVANQLGLNTVNVINTSTNSISATITVGRRPTGICVSPDGTKVYVTNFLDSTVSVINTSTNTVL